MDKIDERKEKIVNFLGEQDGDPERMLKAALSTRFRELKTVEERISSRCDIAARGRLTWHWP